MATQNFELTTTDWVLVGAAPCLLTNSSNFAALIYEGTDAPASLDAPYTVLQSSDPHGYACDAPGMSVWARSLAGKCRIVSRRKGGVADPVPSAPLAYQQITSLAAVKPLPSIPNDATTATVIVEGAGVRMRLDGTDPTATVGMPYAVGQILKLVGAELAAARFIQQAAGAILNVHYAKGATTAAGAVVPGAAGALDFSDPNNSALQAGL